jgi:uncharacterized protein (DUF952 family)
MFILHCMPAAEWKQAQNCAAFGHASVAACGFVHGSSIGYMWRVAPNFVNDAEPLVLLMIDTDKVPAEIKWEDGGEGRLYPHVYGPVPTCAVVQVLPFLKNADGSWYKNPELTQWPDR